MLRCMFLSHSFVLVSQVAAPIKEHIAHSLLHFADPLLLIGLFDLELLPFENVQFMKYRENLVDSVIFEEESHVFEHYLEFLFS